MLILFINRSHPYNIYHSIIPFCILSTHYCSRWRALPSGSAAAYGATRAESGRWNRRGPDCDHHRSPGRLGEQSPVPHLSLVVRVSSAIGRSETAATPGTLATADAGAPRTPATERRCGHLWRRAEIGQRGAALRRGVAQGDTPLLLLADAAPYFRYSPLQLVHQRQVASVEQTIIDHPPDFILFGNEWPTEMRRRWEKFLGERYRTESQVQDGWSILRRIVPPS